MKWSSTAFKSPMTPTVYSFEIGETVWIGASRRAVVVFLHPNEDAVTVQMSGGERRKLPASKITKKCNCGK
jgi:hypothetical protein